MEDAVAEREFTFTYKNWRGEVATRRAFPLRVEFKSTEWHPEPQWLLIAWDAEKEAERDFAIKDINPKGELKQVGWRCSETGKMRREVVGFMVNPMPVYSTDSALQRCAEDAAAAVRKLADQEATDAPVHRVFPNFLRTETNTVATFIMEDGQPGPVACLTGDDHAERGRAIVHAVMSAGLTLTAAAKLVARLAELEAENRALKAKIGETVDGQ